MTRNTMKFNPESFSLPSAHKKHTSWPPLPLAAGFRSTTAPSRRRPVSSWPLLPLAAGFRRLRLRSLSPPLPSAILSPRRDFFRLGSEWRLFLFCPVLTWQRRGFRVRSAAAVASTSLPALRDRSVGVQPPLIVKHWGGGGCFQTLGWKVDKTQTLGVPRLLPGGEMRRWPPTGTLCIA